MKWLFAPAITLLMHQRNKVKMTLAGVVRQTFVRGVCVYKEGDFPSGVIGRWER